MWDFFMLLPPCFLYSDKSYYSTVEDMAAHAVVQKLLKPKKYILHPIHTSPTSAP